ncbi:MAG TPA: hypothetical protein EYN91_10895 [Candidatus Melainabacteria bacterium]|jgi:hypothetical protein|nr:hypothetical protein [Candidatus Melainabacteria bacterium]
MKTAIDNQANVSMALLFASFILVLSLFVFWPRSAGNPTTGYSSDGEAVQSDTISPQTRAKDASTARSYQ